MTPKKKNKKQSKSQSIKDGECFNLRPCILAQSDDHNTRTGPITNTNIDCRLTPNNTWWAAEDVPDLVALDFLIRQDYYDAVRFTPNGTPFHRKMPSKGKTEASPIKEGILNLPSNGPETDAIVDNYAKTVEETTGWRCIRKAIHRDEVYHDPDSGEEHVNCHGHLVFDTYDYMKHCIIQYDSTMYKYLQDLAAKVTGMPRGNPERETGARHLLPPVYKSIKERERAERLALKNDELERAIADLKREKEVISTDLESLTKKVENGCHRLRGLAMSVIRDYDDLAGGRGEEDAREREVRDQLEAEIEKNIADMNQQEQLQHFSLLQRLITMLCIIISRIADCIIKTVQGAQKSSALRAMRNINQVNGEVEIIDTILNDLDNKDQQVTPKEKLFLDEHIFAAMALNSSFSEFRFKLMQSYNIIIKEERLENGDTGFVLFHNASKYRPEEVLSPKAISAIKALYAKAKGINRLGSSKGVKNTPAGTVKKAKGGLKK